MPLKQIIDAALSQIGNVADVNTVIGEPIILPSDVTLIPFSKVSVGFASGGSDFGGKNPKPDGSSYFAGGNGAGVCVTPLGFIAVEKGKVRLIDLKTPESFQAPNDPVNKAFDSINGVIEKGPELFAKIKDIWDSTKKKKEEKKNAEVQEAEKSDPEPENAESTDTKPAE